MHFHCYCARVCVCVCVCERALNGPCSLFLATGLILFSIQCNALFIYPRHFAKFLFCWCIMYHVVAGSVIVVDYRI